MAPRGTRFHGEGGLTEARTGAGRQGERKTEPDSISPTLIHSPAGRAWRTADSHVGESEHPPGATTALDSKSWPRIQRAQWARRTAGDWRAGCAPRERVRDEALSPESRGPGPVRAPAPSSSRRRSRAPGGWPGLRGARSLSLCSPGRGECGRLPWAQAGWRSTGSAPSLRPGLCPPRPRASCPHRPSFLCTRHPGCGRARKAPTPVFARHLSGAPATGLGMTVSRTGWALPSRARDRAGEPGAVCRDTQSQRGDEGGRRRGAGWEELWEELWAVADRVCREAHGAWSSGAGQGWVGGAVTACRCVNRPPTSRRLGV